MKILSMVSQYRKLSRGYIFILFKPALAIASRLKDESDCQIPLESSLTNLPHTDLF